MNDLSKLVFFSVLILLSVIVTAWMLGIIYGIPSGNVARINVEGDIVLSSSILSGYAASDELIREIKSAEDNPNVEAIILAINSPGGEVVASKEVAEYVKNSTKPVVAWIRGVGASGAYLIAAASDYIICDSLSITGSIGATSAYLSFAGLLDKYGVTYNELVSGAYKDIGTPYKNLTDGEREILMGIITDSFDYFLNFVVSQRNLTTASIDTIRDGRIVGGSDAYALGLVDELGGIDSVISYLNSTGVEDVVIEDYSSNSLLSGLSGFLGAESTSILPTYN